MLHLNWMDKRTESLQDFTAQSTDRKPQVQDFKQTFSNLEWSHSVGELYRRSGNDLHYKTRNKHLLHHPFLRL